MLNISSKVSSMFYGVHRWLYSVKGKQYHGLPSSLKHYSTTLRQSPTLNAKRKHTSAVMYFTAMGIAMVGTAYAGVPLYRMFCAVSSLIFIHCQINDLSSLL